LHAIIANQFPQYRFCLLRFFELADGPGAWQPGVGVADGGNGVDCRVVLLLRLLQLLLCVIQRPLRLLQRLLRLLDCLLTTCVCLWVCVCSLQNVFSVECVLCRIYSL
jgi:hypothetical protein